MEVLCKKLSSAMYCCKALNRSEFNNIPKEVLMPLRGWKQFKGKFSPIFLMHYLNKTIFFKRSGMFGLLLKNPSILRNQGLDG